MLKIATLISLMVGMVAAPAILVTPASAASVFQAQYGGYTNGYWRGPRDGQCWNNKRGC